MVDGLFYIITGIPPSSFSLGKSEMTASVVRNIAATVVSFKKSPLLQDTK